MMGLDIYSGTLSRYYSRDWQTILQSMGAVVVYPNGEPEKFSFQEAFDIVDRWRGDVNASIADASQEEFIWNEGKTTPYFTDKLGHESIFALFLWAAYIGAPDIRRPKGVINETVLSNDKMYKQSISEDANNPIVATLRCRLFFPSASKFLFDAPLPNGRLSQIGTTEILGAVLNDINKRSWQATLLDIENWSHAGPPEPLENNEKRASWFSWNRNSSKNQSSTTKIDETVDRAQDAAKFAFAVLSKTLEFSNLHNVPIMMDD